MTKIKKLIFLSLLPLLSLFKPGMFTAHDSQAHVVRIAQFFKSLTEGNIFPRWAHDLNAGYGHPIFMFLYPLPSYLSSFFYFFGFNFATSIKIVLGLGFISSAIFMYLWLSKHFSKLAAFLGSLIFIMAPYRFVNLYVRNALGESTSFAFVPLTFLTFHNLFKKISAPNIIWASISLGLLILSHNAVSLMFLPIIIIYLALLIFPLKKESLKKIIYLSLAGLIGLCLAAFFWIPALLEGKYTLRNTVMQGNTFTDHFSSISQLIFPNWGYGNSYQGTDDDLSLQIGVVQIISFISALILVVKNRHTIKPKAKRLIYFFLAIFILSSFLMLKISLPLWQLLPIIKKFQFPWRFLILPVFASSVLAPAVIDWLPKSKFKINQIVNIVIIVLLIQNFTYWHPKDFNFPKEQELFKTYLGTTDTGESTPLWAVRSQNKRADNTLGIVHGAPITYQIIRRESEIHEYIITTTQKTQIAENTLYFPGWTVYVDSVKTNIIFDDISWRGVITYPVEKGSHHVKLVFEETVLRKTANSITILGLILIILIKIRPELIILQNEKN